MTQEKSAIRYFPYTRKSSEDKGRQILSIKSQKEELEKFPPYENLLDTLEESRTAKKPGRQVFNKMLDDIEAGMAQGIKVWHPDRLSRNAEDTGRLIGLMDRNKLLEVVTPTQTFRNNNPMDKFMLGFLCTQAKLENDTKAVNVKRGLDKKVDMGWFPGLVPAGWDNTRSSVRGSNTIIVDKLRFPLIQDAIKLILYSGYTPMEALSKLNNESKFTTIRRKKVGGGPMRRTPWYNLLNNPFLYGWYERNGILTKGEHIPMINKEEFERLQTILGSKGRRISKTREFAYTKLMVCGECKSGITAEQKNQMICSACKFKFAYENKVTCPNCQIPIENMRKQTILNYVFYHCTKKKNPKCAQGSIQVQDLEKQIDEYLKSLQTSEKYCRWAIKHLKESHELESGTRQSIQETQQAAYNKITRNLDSLMQMRIDGEVDEAEYAKQKSKLLQEKEKYEQLMSDISRRQNQALELSERTFRFICCSRFWLRDGSINDKKEILATLSSNLTLNNKILHIDAPEPFKIIQRGLASLQLEKSRLEPEKSLVNKKQNAQVLPARLAWLGRWDSNPRPIG